MNICPGCGRCRECGEPTPYPYVPQPLLPYTPPTVEPWREPTERDFIRPFIMQPERDGPITITCQLDGSNISEAVIGQFS